MREMKYCPRDEDSKILELPDAELHYRQRYLMKASLLFSVFAAEGILVGMFDSEPLGYLITTFFGVATVFWAARLLTPPEVLLELPASHFLWIAPSEPGVLSRQPEMPSTEKLPLSMPKPAASMPGVWDRELDGGL